MPPDLSGIFDLSPAPGASEIVIYTEEASPRLQYTCRFIFSHVLHVPHRIVTEKAAIKKFDIVISYAVVPQKGLHILPSGLLGQKGITAEKPRLVNERQLYLFRSEPVAGFHFDVFSAIFWLISRYEEWQHFEADKHGRFEFKSSLLCNQKSHLIPVVDRWIAELADAIRTIFPDFASPANKFRVISTIDVDNLYAYRGKGLFRTTGAILKDILRMDFDNLKERMAVVFGRKTDPFDVYEEVADFCRLHKVPLFFFFLLRNGTRYDRTLNPGSNEFSKVFRILKESQAHAGIHPSYDSVRNDRLLVREQQFFERHIGRKASISRQHFLRYDVRTTPKLLMKQGIKADFTMGYAGSPGFRAGTSHPFYYYDFENEQSTEFLLVPFCVMEGAYTVYQHTAAGDALEPMLQLAREIKKTGGYFITAFHERSFYDRLYPGFGNLYKKLLQKAVEMV